MTLTIPHTALASALSAASKVVEAKNMLPILAMVRLSASDGAMEIVTTNLDVEYRQSLPCTGSLPAVCVDSQKISKWVAKATGEIIITIDKSALTIKSGRSRMTAPTLPADDFPLMPEAPLCKPVPFNSSPIIKQVLWAASNEVTRAYLNGVYMNDHGGKVCFAATDGGALAVVSTATKWPSKAPNVTLSPAFLKAIPEAGGLIQWDAVRAQFTAGGATVTGKVIDAGAFPDYRRIFPEPCEPYAVDCGELIAAVHRVRLGSDARERKLRIVRRDGVLALRIEGTAGFDAAEEIDADCVDGFESCTNADTLVSMLTAMDTDRVSIEQIDETKPFVLRPISHGAEMKFEGILSAMRF